MTAVRMMGLMLAGLPLFAAAATIDLGADFDATQHGALEVSVRNRADRPVRLTLELKAKGDVKLRGWVTLGPRESRVHAFDLLPKAYSLGFPLKGVGGYLPNDLKTRFADARTLEIFEPLAETDVFEVTGVKPVGPGRVPTLAVAEKDFFPFCDRYGQFRHRDWPGKVKSDEDLAKDRDREAAWLDAHPESPIAGADRFGGWAEGPQLEATGAFRVEKVDGRWWFVDPDGHLFFSSGIAGVRMPQQTSTKGREKFFASLEGVTSDGSVNFGLLNVMRKYGKKAKTGDVVHRLNQRRLRAWGVNTIGNWSDEACWSLRQTPYTDHIKTHGVSIDAFFNNRRRTMIDVFDAGFARDVRRKVEACAKRSGDDPWCLGWFVDNELPWGVRETDLGRWVLAAKEDQPARIALVEMLKARHGADFDPQRATDDDLKAYLRLFAERYFRTIRDEIRRVAPKRLYLGPRICHSRVNHAVWEAMAEYCDVMSANWYNHLPDVSVPPDIRDRPLIIGEFHFGALDRGNLEGGVITVADQRARADAYRAYLRAAIASGRIVGAHWFLFRDQPLTGRTRDVEAYQSGFVDVTDRPYPELVAAAREIAAELYVTKPNKENGRK